MVQFDLIHFAENISEQYTMRDISLLHDLLKNQCPNVHQKGLSSLMVVVQSLHRIDSLKIKPSKPGCLI